jgi:N-acetylglucosaminyldiphosphoundecaprenol N-acetyl-beta-D-mannosaminyltransferase
MAAMSLRSLLVTEQHALNSPLVDLPHRQPRGGGSDQASDANGDRRPQGRPVTDPDIHARDVVCILGLPFDAITLQDAVQRVRDAVRARRRLFLSTPNLNFLIGCQSDAAFRRSVIDSDLSVADGMPLIWMSRLLGTPLPERVTGSDLFERLRNEPLPPGRAPIRVYFFGGPPGAAEAAAHRLNVESSAMVCVGYESPGFGSVEDLSDQEMIDRINAGGADFLVVAMGAAKGQAWIQRNRERLQAPVISHLGAVVNFAAGTVSRAPAWVQRAGFEWLWRIKEEPVLWRRYGRDARAFLGLFAGKLLPHLVWLCTHRPAGASAPAEATLGRDGQGTRLHLRGNIPEAIPEAIHAALRGCAALSGPVSLDLGQVDHFGPRFAGRLLQFERTLAAGNRPLRLIGLSSRTRRLFRWHGLESLLERAQQP